MLLRFLRWFGISVLILVLLTIVLILISGKADPPFTYQLS